MADYKTIHGTKVRTYTTNPDNPIEGQVWYNDTDNVLKFQFPNRASSWRTANALNTARYYNPTAGTTTAAICMGGSEPPFTTATEIWNGTSWTTGGSMSTARYGGGGAGTTASSIVFAGYTTTAVADTEEYTGPEGQVTETFSTE